VFESHKRFTLDVGSAQVASSVFCLYSVVTEEKLIGDNEPIGESNYMTTIAEMDRVVKWLIVCGSTNPAT
jgi:hypothetical protein